MFLFLFLFPFFTTLILIMLRPRLFFASGAFEHLALTFDIRLHVIQRSDEKQDGWGRRG